LHKLDSCIKKETLYFLWNKVFKTKKYVLICPYGPEKKPDFDELEDMNTMINVFT